MLLNKIHEIGKECSGCSLCASICPNEAIVMSPNKEGFFMPAIDEGKCINCGLCERKCPQLNLIKDNYADPSCYAVKADSEILKVSSSGGVFTVLSEYVFEKGGYVCGAAYDDNFTGVSHIMISDRSEMYKLRGSKYVYSKPNGIYKQVKDKLNEGHYVLFSGTPCQVAALNAYLPQKYEKLITVDLLCAGVPSEKIFSKYISEVAQGKKVTSISFRPKEYGWEYTGIQIKFDDDSEYIIHSIRDPYLKGFLNSLFKCDACKNCSYATLPRQGDFTIGDFWGIEKYDDSIDTKEGVSSVMLNNTKSESIFKEVRDRFVFAKKIHLPFLLSHNQCSEKRRSHLAKTRFYYLLNNGFSFTKAVDYALKWKFDIALTGCWTVRNYGGELTYYALYKTLRSMGYTVIMVERRVDIPNYNIPNPSLFNKNPYPFYDVSRIHKSFTDQRELNERVKTFICGSDQIWNFRLMNEESIKSYTMDYVADWRKKIAYATSFGSVELAGNEEQQQELAKLISRLNYVSVREKSGIDICSKIGVKAEWTIDPLLLCDKEDYNELLKNSSVTKNEKYVFAYFLWPNSFKYGLDKFSQILNLDYVITVNADEAALKRINFSETTFPYPYIKNCKLEDWLYYAVNSTYIVTDSFHATCLAIAYKKPFVFVKGNLNEHNGLERITSLLEPLGLMDRIADTVESTLKDEKYMEEIDYNRIYKILDKEKERSINWLKKAIDSELI